jgi:prepilin-type N-terminal cleavage/methylation domain-containing protein
VKSVITTRGRSGHQVKPRGFTLLELIITLGVLSIVAVAALPYMKNSVKREREYVLRSNLRTMRKAIDLYYINCEYLKQVSVLDQQEGFDVLSARSRDVGGGNSPAKQRHDDSFPAPNSFGSK